MDGLYETFLTILNQFDSYPAVIDRENQHYFPFLATTTLLMRAVQAGAGREEAHEAIKEHAVATVLDLRNGTISENNLAERLGQDSRLGLDTPAIEAVIADAASLTGAAQLQIDTFLEAVQGWGRRIPDAIIYQPGNIL
jgi:adenylosuccinate lyase